MAESGEPLRKKTKFDGIPITKEQLDDIRHRLRVHKEYVQEFDDSFIVHSQPRFSFLKIIDCNAQKSICFSSAWCKILPNVVDTSASIEHKCRLPFNQLFNVELLNDVLHEKDEGTVNKKQYRALEKLADFLHNKSDHADKLWKTSQSNNLKEVDWAKVISAHLVSKLAVAKDVTLDNEYSTSSGKYCPCNCGTELVFNDNSMGHEEVWHGSVDILVGKSAVVISSVSDSSDSTDGMYDFELEVAKVDFDQVLAESVVFSMTQKDRDLAPTLLITKNDMRVYIYEKKHDLLLESPPITIFNHNGTSLDPLFVLSLWFTLNYHYFTDDTMFMELKPDDERFLYHADFFKYVSEREQVIYKEHLRFSGCENVQTAEQHMEWSHSARGPVLPISFVRKYREK